MALRMKYVTMILELEIQELSDKNPGLKKKAEEQFQISLKQQQDERAALQKASEILRLTEVST